MPSPHDRILGSLLGGACGDALGAPVEFMDLDTILTRFGPNGITDFVPAYGLLGATTDDTQMTLFTAEGLIRAYVRQMDKGICHTPSVVHNAYRRWLVTQEHSFKDRRRLDPAPLSGWLMGHAALWHQRVPGATCLSALRSTRALGQPANNISKGCGAVMRSAPFGFLARSHDDLPWIFSLAVDCARLTHNHPSGYLTAGALAVIVAEIMLGSPLNAAVSRATSFTAQHKDADEVVASLNMAMRLAKEPNWRERLPELGEGWIAEEALAIAVTCALATSTPEEAIIAAVNITGDSDSTGAITGNIVGALHGPSALPVRWAEVVEMRFMIEGIAADLAGVVAGEPSMGKLRARYPGF